MVPPHAPVAPPPDADIVFAAAPDPVAVLSAAGALLSANPAFRAAFRQPVTPQRPPWGRVALPPAHNGQRRFDAAAPDGRLFEWTEQVLPGGARLVVAHDVTARAEAAAAAAKARTSLFATLTHELRTPLNGILGMAGLLAQTRLDPAEQAYLDAIRSSGEHLLELITEILDYARLEAGQTTIEAHPFDPEATAQSVCELLSPRARAKGLELAVQTAGAVPALVSGDDGRLRQILFNLAGNAVKFTETGGAVIEVAPSSPGQLRFTVRDTGPGVAPNKQAVIFEEFAHADPEDGRRHGGAGLGLAIVRRLAHAMGGASGLESRPGQGAAFWVELPLAPLAPPPFAGDALAGLSALVVSPSPILARTLCQALQDLGARALWRRSLAAVGAAWPGPDVALVDEAACPAPAEDPAFAPFLAAPARVVALAPQERRAALDRFRAAGIDRFLITPLRRRSLVERLAAAAPKPPPDDDRLATPSLRGLRVLLAEDNPVNALLARTLLTRAGCVVDTVADGVEACEQIARAAYDVALFDVRMPRLDGLGAARRVRAMGGRFAALPLLAVTADAGEDDRRAALAAGFSAFLTKPINPEALAHAIADFTKPATGRSL